MTDADMVDAPASTADAAAAASAAAAAAKALAKGKAPTNAAASSADALARAAATAASAPWVEKYRPNTLDDVASHGEIIETIRRLVSENRLPHLLLYGPPGTGKTSTILAVARALYGAAAMPSMVLELNASDDRGIGVVRQQVVDFASTRTIFSNKFKLVILDECDAMTKDAQFALRRVIEKYTRNARFCLIANYASKIIPALQSRCTRFRFAPLPDADVRERVLAVAGKEGVRLAPGGLDAVVTLGGGDMRRTLNILQSVALASGGGGGGGAGGDTTTAAGAAPTTATTPAAAAAAPSTSPPSANNGEIEAAAVYACTGDPTPEDIEQAARALLNLEFADAMQVVSSMQRLQGFALVDIVRGLGPLCFRLGGMPQGARAALVSALADVEYSLAFGVSERLQLGAVVGAFAEAREAIVEAAK